MFSINDGQVRSRSSEDLGGPCIEFSNGLNAGFFRQGAFRKRTAGLCENTRSSVTSLLTNDLLEGHCSTEPLKFERPSEIIGLSPRYHKNSMLLSAVKDVWKSLRYDVKDTEFEIGRRPRQNSDHCFRKSKVLEFHASNVQMIINNIVLHINGKNLAKNWVIESSWTDIVRINQDFTKRDHDLQASIWELIVTELTCLNFLSIVVEVFRPVFVTLQEQYVELSSIKLAQLFGNIDEVYRSNVELWTKCISLPLHQARSDHEPLDILLMKDGFKSISSILSAYKEFMQAQNGMSKYFQSLEKNNSVFREYILWTKNYSKSYRDGVKSILSAPFQRITKYKLLLERIKDFVREEHIHSLSEMIDSVHSFLTYINLTVNGDFSLSEIKAKLVIKSLMRQDSLEYGFIDDQQLQFDITQPLSDFPDRILIHEGQLKLKKKNKRTEVQCYLFNDVFLVCKPLKKDWNKLSVLKSPIRLDKMFIKDHIEGGFLVLVFNDFSTVDYVLIFNGENDSIKLWMDKCNKTIDQFRVKMPHSVKIPDKITNSLNKRLNKKLDNSIVSRPKKSIVSEISVSGYSTASGDSFLEDASNFDVQSLEYQTSVLSQPSHVSFEDSTYQTELDLFPDKE